MLGLVLKDKYKTMLTSLKDRMFLNSYLNGKEFVFVTIIDKNFLEVSDNWFENLKQFGHDKNVLFICSDEVSYNHYQNKNTPSIFLSASSPSGEDLTTPEERTIIGYGGVFKLISTILFLIKNYNVTVIRCHVDVLFLKDPIHKIKQELENNDMLINNNKKPLMDILKYGNKETNNSNPYIQDTKPFMEDIPDGFATDLSLFCIKNSENVKFFTDLIQKEKDEILKFQDSFSFNKSFRKYLAQSNIKISYLSYVDFLNGFVFEYKNNNCLDAFNKIIENAYSIHYNICFEDMPWTDFERRKNIKIKAMKSNNHWFL